METLITLPAFMAGLFIVLGLFYTVLGQFLVEHWIYQSGICLSKLSHKNTVKKN